MYEKFIGLYFALFVALFACNERDIGEVNQTSSITEPKRTVRLGQITDYPRIKDTSLFIADLRKIAAIENAGFQSDKKVDKITYYKKVNIYGSDKDYLFVEYDYGYDDGTGADYPWKYQFLLTMNGECLTTFSAQRFEFVKVFNFTNPFLLVVNATSKGNGGHQLFKMVGDSLENAINTVPDDEIKTFDAHDDSQLNEPHELHFKVKDFNQDGLNDISFHGKIVRRLNETSNIEKISVEYVFIYDKQTGHFKAKK